MTVHLSPEQEEIIKRTIEAGRYNVPQEAFDAAMRLLEEDEIVREFRLNRLRRDIDQGIQQVDRGEVKSFDPDEMKRRLRENLPKKNRPKAAASV